MGKLAGVRVLEIPKFRAVSSGIDTYINIIRKREFDKWKEMHNEFIKKVFMDMDMVSCGM